MENKKKQRFSVPFNLVYERFYPDLLIGPGIYKERKIAKNNTPNNWINSKIPDIEKKRKEQEFVLKKYNKKDAVNVSENIRNIQWLAQAKKTTEIEIETSLKKRQINENVTGIKNISYELEKIKIAENIKVPKIIDKTINDNELKAKDAILQLNNKLNDVYKIEDILSLGLLGIKKDRLFVPTRWAITSVDDTISKQNINTLYQFESIDKYILFTNEFYDNKFYVILTPYNWGFEMIESSDNNLIIDYEINKPKKEYASNVTGAYYAARLEVTNYLKKIKRQARIIILRDIDPKYNSQGVWVIREAIKKSLLNKPLIFETLNQLLNNIENTKIRNGIEFWVKPSNIIKNIKYQKRLFDFK
jgi:hypothetical protein